MRADGRRFRVEAYSHSAGAQTRFSDDDFQRARIGGIRTRVYTKNPGTSAFVSFARNF